MKIAQIKPMEFNEFKGTTLLQYDKDLNICIEIQLDKASGEFIIGKVAFEMIKKLSTNQTIKLTDKTITIISDEGVYKGALINADSIKKPDFTRGGGIADIVHVKQETLRKATKFVLDSKQPQGMMNGVCVDYNGGICSTNRGTAFRSATSDLHEKSVSLPIEAINAIPSAEEASIYITERYACLSIDRFVTVYTRLITGAKVPFEKIFAFPTVNTCELDKDELIAKMKLYPTEYVALNFSEDNLKITQNEFTTNMVVKSTQIGELKFSYKLLLEVLDCLNEELTTLNFNTNGILTINDSGCTYLIAPIRKE